MAAHAQSGEFKLLSYPGRVEAAGISKTALAQQIQGDSRLDTVQAWPGLLSKVF